MIPKLQFPVVMSVSKKRNEEGKEEVTLDRAKSAFVMEATSFIWPTDSIRSFTTPVCSARASLRTFLMRLIWPSAH